MAMMKSFKRSSKNLRNPLPGLSILAQDIIDMALNEKEIYSPILKRWHPLPAGAAVAVLHACYGNELKQFVAGISELSPDAVIVLHAADKLERVLVQIAIEDSVESEDGGKAIIQEIAPFGSEGLMGSLVKTWIKTRVDRLSELVDRNLKQEVSIDLSLHLYHFQQLFSETEGSKKNPFIASNKGIFRILIDCFCTNGMLI